jgi:hypothetical protein
MNDFTNLFLMLEMHIFKKLGYVWAK